jgi:D-glycero-alpha-D-manno-heptose-7-phosphate kinase
MLITRSPLRISLGGGGTDLPSYYSKYGGFLIAAAIDKYVYITLHQTFIEELIIKYSSLEKVNKVDDIKHLLVRETLKYIEIEASHLEISSMADIPAGTGLGSSGSFTTALLKNLHAYKKNLVHPQDLAEQACHIELERVAEPIGKQDQYIAAYGGLTCFEFSTDDNVSARPLKIDSDTLYQLEDNLLLFFTGYSRSASSILKEQDEKSKNNDQEMIEHLHFIKELALKSKSALEAGDLIEFSALMNKHWLHKQTRSEKMSNVKINQWYELALNNGALGGKLIGAGGGGFLMFYAQDKVLLRRKMREAGLQEVRFRFDFEGTKLIAQS